MKDWFKAMLAPATTPDKRSTRLDAIAGLLVYAGALDGRFEERERIAVQTILCRMEGVDRAAATAAMTHAEPQVKEAADIFQFTRELNAHIQPEERTAIVEALWEVILTDGEIDAYEASLMRRLGSLIHVPDRDLGEARQRVAARLREGRKSPW
jgi:uncharacterized tellurite resistance protein B-like protein